ncbi:MAG: efflux RND transporter periplasmic adaptor subunit [Deltaproteobacteria bacterium]|nr:efflux RND transporter periplasmic adaptor subunit [Deltaproteobacteria bacterium]MBW2447687.1 efflux RND transporter periplasmic adaptor subunit [Deltaproteobacteria bacterium]
MRRLALAAITLTSLSLACGDDEAPPVVGASPVAVAAVQAHDVVDRIEATGELIAKEEATVAAQVAGPITSIAAVEGGSVEAGETLLEIDPERRQLEALDARAGVDEARANLKEREREARRIRALGERGAASKARIDAAGTATQLAGSRLSAAQARLGIAERSLRDASVAAPFAGLVARRHVSTGEFVSAGQALFDLVALDPIEVEFHLAEIDSARVSLGDAVEVRVAPYPDEVFTARATMIAPTIDARTRTLRVKAEVDNSDGRLRPGLFARVDLGVATREAVPMVAQEAVLQRADGAVVFILEGSDRVRRVNVKTGVYRGSLVEIRAGIEAGMQVIIRGHAELIDGSAVTVRNLDGSAAAVAAQ